MVLIKQTIFKKKNHAIFRPFQRYRAQPIEISRTSDDCFEHMTEFMKSIIAFIEFAD